MPLSLAEVLPFLQQGQPPPDPSQQAPSATAPIVGPPADNQALPDQNAVNTHNAAAAPPVPPQQTKGHKLLQILQGGLMGGLSGLAANAQTYAATGRNAGVGGGIGAGFTQSLPFQSARQGQELAQAAAQTRLTQQQGDMIDTPYGKLPATLAKMIFPAAITAQGKANVANIQNTGKENVANIQATSQQNIHRFIPVQGVGLFDSQTKQVMPNTDKGITVTPEIAADHQLPQQFIGKQMQLSDFNSMMRFENQQSVVAQGANGPSLVNKKTGKTTDLGLGNPGMGKPMEVADPNNPGQTIVSTGGQAQGAAGKGSASVKAATKAAEAEVPTKIGDQKVAFTTAMQHADLLTSAIKALNNGDVQTLNSLKNRFATEFGATGPINAQVISSAYAREIASMLSKGHMTDSEIGSAGSTLNVNAQSPQQSLGVLAAYRALAQSKMNMLNKQKQSAINQSQPGKTINYNIVNGVLVPQ